MKRIASLIVIAFGVIVVLFFSLPTIMNLFTSDPPVDDSDLRTNSVKFLDQDNAYFDLLRAYKANLSFEDKEQIRSLLHSDAQWNQASAETLLKKYAELLAVFSSAASKPIFQYPITPEGERNFDDNIVKIAIFASKAMRWLDLAHLQTKLLSKTGQNREAMENALKIVKLASLLRGPHSPILAMTIGSATIGQTLKRLHALLEDSNLDTETMKTYIENLNIFRSNSIDVHELLKYEYQFLVNDSKDIFDVQDLKPWAKSVFKLLGSFYTKINQSKLLLANVVRGHIQAPPLVCGKEENALNTEPPPSSSLFSMYFTENGAGKAMIHAVSLYLKQSLRRFSIANCNTDFMISATQAIMGIKGYKAENGSLPNSLEQLVPNYLPSVPLDPYSGQKILYSKTSKQIKSIGKYASEPEPVQIPDSF